jgi:ABC-2 type transport system permease protein
MTRRVEISIVARREVVERVRQKSFIISTLSTLVIIALITVLPAALGLGETESYEVGATTDAGEQVGRAAAAADETFDAEIRVRRVGEAQVAAALRDGELDAVVDGRTIRAQDEPDDALLQSLQAAHRQLSAASALQGAGVDASTARAALAPEPLPVRTVEVTDEDRERLAGVAFFTALILYLQLIGYGYAVAGGVVEEKASRVVEVLLSTVRPNRLLAGKIIGIGIVGFVQLLIIVIVGLAVAVAGDVVDLERDVVGAMAFALLWFVLGFAFYSGVYAVTGALVPRQEELQSVSTPVTFLLIIAYFISFAAFQDPEGVVATVASVLPPTAPMVLPTLIILGEVAAWQVVAGIGLTVAATIALVPVAGRIYAGGVLHTRAAVKLKDAWRSSSRA